MLIKVPLRVVGLDLRVPDEFARLHEDLVELDWESRGDITIANVLVDPGSDAVAEALDWARRIAKHIVGVRVTDVFDELVGLSDIAARAGVSAESVRLWSLNQRRTIGAAFPVPAQWLTTGGKEMKLYLWREVLAWLRTQANLDPDEGVCYLDAGRIAEINAELAPVTPQYRPLPNSTWHGRVSTPESHEAGWAGTSSRPDLQRFRPLPVAQ